MKKITILNQELFYEKGYDQSFSEFSSNEPHTNVYIQEGLIPELKWSWSKFKKIPTGELIPNYIRLGKIGSWIEEDNNYSKLEVNEKFEKLLSRYLKLRKRTEELKNNEIY